LVSGACLALLGRFARGRGGTDWHGHFGRVALVARDLPLACRVVLAGERLELVFRVLARAAVEAALDEAEELRIAARFQLVAAGWVGLLHCSFGLLPALLVF